MKLMQKTPFIKTKIGVFLTVVSIIFSLIVSLAIYVTKVIDPLHIPLAFLFVYIAYRQGKKLFFVYVSTKKVDQITKKTSHFTRLHKTLIVFILLCVSLWYTVISIIPTDKEIFSSMDNNKQTEIVSGDIENSAVLLDMLVISGNKLLENPNITKNELSQEDMIHLKKEWEQFIKISIETEKMTDRHRYFPQISMFDNRETHIKSFVIAYALYAKKFEIFDKIISKVNNNQAVIKVFNEYSEDIGVGSIYDDVANRFFASNSFLRRNIGYIYYVMSAPNEDEVSSANYAMLLEVSRTSYHNLFKNIFSHVKYGAILYKHYFDKTAFEAWLPIQKNVITNQIGNIHVGERVEKFITISQIEEMKKTLKPGDILLYRKNWYASNLGIPGFWTHAGLYTGTLEEMNVFFADVFPYQGHASFSELVQNERPKVYKAYLNKDKKGFTPSVVESQTHGTLIQSIETSASVDYFAVTRTRLSKQEIIEAIVTAFSHYEKPYDYAFDLGTKNEIYCSELVYDAYLKTSKSRGVTFPKPVVTGKVMVPPSSIIEKFVAEFDSPERELDFVYFLDASEITKKAFPSDVVGFISTNKRQKYSIMQE
ncbi:MAG: hypothetical protein KBC41_02800 [Candidatus Pacebacteria bacterium]|nr:hypothetical protein [Candidatus Paceibacterota bacterium]MBP9866983.1 hypothetical protein [Candidatus Paceibacterota bacterium]